jgi:DNA-directed RNA polymerase subunit RPC12/RpoP
MFVAEKRAECAVCDREFAPLSSTETFVCGGCDPNHRRADAGGECALCGNHSEFLIHQDIAVCRRCATDPDQRKLFIKALARKRNSAAEQ